MQTAALLALFVAPILGQLEPGAPLLDDLATVARIDVVLPVLIFAIALIFSSVGHAGASGYLAVMALAGVAPAAMRPSALLLNILVASIGTVRFHRAGHLRWRILLPFAAGSIPFAFLGGMLSLPDALYARLLGVILLFATWRLFRLPPTEPVSHDAHGSRWFLPLAVLCGMGIGLLAGLTGIGGGVFLSPLLILSKWANPRQSAGIAAAFILMNSVAGVLGRLASVATLPPAVGYWAVCAVLGGIIGSELGVRRLKQHTLRRMLAVVLLMAGGKLLMT